MKKFIKSKWFVLLVVIAIAVSIGIYKYMNIAKESRNYADTPVYVNGNIKAVYLAPIGEKQISNRDLKLHPEVLTVHDLKELNSYIQKYIIPIWIDKNVIDMLPDNWVNQEPQRFYPIILVGFGNPAEEAVKLNLPIIGIPPEPFRDKRKLMESGFSIWLVTEMDKSSFGSKWQGYPGKININHVLAVSDNLLKKCLTDIQYRNKKYYFTFSLPLLWKGYKIIETKWNGNAPNNNVAVPSSGAMVIIRHPLWSVQKPRQDIPIMIFTIEQWNALQKGEFHIGAAPIGPTELGRNSKYVFALPARYNYAFLSGYEEIEQILRNNPLKAF